MPIRTTVIDRTKKINLHHQAVIETALLKNGYCPYSNGWIMCDSVCPKCDETEMIYYAGWAQMGNNIRPIKIASNGAVSLIREDGLTDGMLLDLIRAFL